MGIIDDTRVHPRSLRARGITPEMIYEDYQRLKSCQAVADKHNIAPSTVSRYCLEARLNNPGPLTRRKGRFREWLAEHPDLPLPWHQPALIAEMADVTYGTVVNYASKAKAEYRAKLRRAIVRDLRDRGWAQSVEGEVIPMENIERLRLPRPFYLDRDVYVKYRLYSGREVYSLFRFEGKRFGDDAA